MKRRTFLGGVAGGGFGSLATSRTDVDGASFAATNGSSGSSGTPSDESGNGTSGSGPTTTTAKSSAGGGKTHTVKMVTDGGEYYFDPVGLYVEPGDTVEWVIESGAHTATSYSKSNQRASVTRIPKEAAPFDSGMLEKKGAAYSYTFEVPGTYDYYCSPHKTLGMVGRIVCGEPGGPAQKGSIPDAPGSGVMPDAETIVEEKSLAYPYIPESNVSKGLPPLFWFGSSVFGATFLYLLSKYDRESGRYASEHADGVE